jgi:hypothetical protein
MAKSRYALCKSTSPAAHHARADRGFLRNDAEGCRGAFGVGTPSILAAAAAVVKFVSRSHERRTQNFLALCASGAYDECLFHRNIPGFMIQTGDPTGTGKGGQSIWGAPFDDEIRSTVKVRTH